MVKRISGHLLNLVVFETGLAVLSAGPDGRNITGLDRAVGPIVGGDGEAVVEILGGVHSRNLAPGRRRELAKVRKNYVS